MFRRIAIVNRGEAAMRLIHAVRELNAAGGEQIETVALYTDAESSAKFVREADLGYPIGPASARPYLDYQVLERALRETGADAAWVGWGFVAEDPAFAELCERLGVTFIGPSPEAMRALGDKIGSKLLAEKVGVPVAPWSQGAVDDLRSALTKAETLGYPLMLKATAGGGGRGIRVVRSAQELTAAFNQTRDEAVRAFGSGVMFLETMLSGARHVEVQVVADGQGAAWAIGVRDCSVQRRNQKVIEESSSVVLAPHQVAELKASAERLALAVDYRGAGTVEFLYRPSDGMFAFLEVNTRLQVEHPITELTTGLDLVKMQIEVAAGGRLIGQPPVELGHAVEARLNAEDPDRDFAPAPGRIALLDLPDGPGVRVDTGFSTGDSIPADFDSMIAKIIAHGRTRDEALARLRRAVRDTTVIIEGGATNKSFVLDLLAEPEVIAATADTGWIDRTRAEGGLVSHQHAGIALVAAAIEANEVEERAERLHFFATAHGGRPQARHKVSRAIDLTLRGASYRVNVSQLGPDRYRVGVAKDGEVRTVDARIERLNSYVSRLEVGDQRYRLVSATHGIINLIEVNGVTHRVSRDEGGVLRSPAPALVVAVPVAVGDEVPAGAPVLVLESMKMETVLYAPFPARVRELLVSTGGQVETGTPMVRLEPLVEADGAAESAPAEAEALVLELPTGRSGSAAARAAGCLGDLRSLLLGFDLSDSDADRTLSAYQRFRAELASGGHCPVTAELGVFRAFADLCELSRNRPGGEEVPGERMHSPREYFHSYLHSLDVDREQLPDAFRRRLSQALTHYGVTELERTPALEEAVYRIYLAQPGASAHLHLVTSLLQQWMLDDAPGDEIAEQVRDVLERLIAATQLRYPVVGDLARSVRFRWFDQPLVDAVRASVLAGVRDELRYLAANPGARDYARRINALAAIPEQIVRFLAERLEAGIGEHEPMLEVLARRHYREYELHDLRGLHAADRPFVVCDYTLDDRPTHLVTTVAELAELVPGSALVTALEQQLQAAPAGHQGVLDLYVLWPEVPDSAVEASAQLQAILTKLEITRQVRRVVTAICPGSGRPVSYYTFRPQNEGGLVEDDLVRGVHPMVGRRLKMWRLQEFNITRLDAPEDVLLYLLVAPNNESDRRLVALAQIREFAVVRDAEGHVVSLPHAERAVASCGEAIRRARASLGGARLDMNYVALHVWPTVDAPVSELTALQRTISPLTVGAGIEEVIAEGMVVAPDGRARNTVVRFSFQPGAGVVTSVSGRLDHWLHPLDDYAQKVLRARRRGTVYPYELVGMLSGRDGSFIEHDLGPDGRLAPVDRPPGGNRAGIVVGVTSTPTDRHPQGITRVVLLGDPTRALGAVAEPECARVIAALDLAEELSVPVEWFALSAGARISMDSGTENMDWVARALRRIVTFTQAGGEINVVVAGINVGAQPYWNAEATMLMHTKGILVMTPDSAMVLTGKQSLDFSGGVSAEDNFGIGGYDRVMGPNGQAQYWVPNLAAACELLLDHYAHTYIAAGERAPRLIKSTDPVDRDISDYPHQLADSEFRTVGDIFSPVGNPDRKKPFDIRSVMRAVADQDSSVLERWAGMADAETSVVFDAHLGGRPVCLIGIESRAIPRRGFPPSDGPDLWTAGTLFPRSSKKTARAINAASGNRPVVMLANLSGFDGSPDSMRNLQLEYGAEIGRAVVNFEGPIVFCVVSRYHGGAFVVFSKALNSEMTVLAIEGSYASVLGGAPAAAVVFTGEVDARTARDPRIKELEERGAAATGIERAALATELAELRSTVRVEKLAEVAAQFDAIHSIQRAVEVGSVDAVIGAHELRPRLIQALDDSVSKGRAVS
ncbi:MAG TPA: carboxyl transferase domain-containing protein [Jatrophihabitans sp.]|uniref:ATP-binding protein n=1 Tax=Jatrophihabitans sp. TaxID=1932789 RepID=UPI002F107F5D